MVAVGGGGDRVDMRGERGFEERERESCVPIVFSPSQLTEINDGTFLLYTPRILFRKI